MSDSVRFPAEFIEDELHARGLSSSELADRLGSNRAVERLLSGRAAMTAEMARRLGDAFGTGAGLWLHLDAAAKRFNVNQTLMGR
jgi:addiction module HigA family antidote